ncbi:MAG: hypothetical protein AAGJ79_11240 [Verrucomicrobiota bacterium]
MIQSVRINFVTGDDDLRGDSGLAFKFWLDDFEATASRRLIYPYAPSAFGAPNTTRWGSHSIREVNVPVGAWSLDRLRAVGIEHVRDDSNDEWDMAGIVVVGLTATGDEFVLFADMELDFRFRGFTLGRTTDWKSSAIRYRGTTPLSDEFNALNIQLKTGDDDLRRGSRVFVRIHFADASIVEVPLVDPDNPDEEWSNHEGKNVSVALPGTYRYSQVRWVKVRMEGDNAGGMFRDDWDVDAMWVDGFRTMSIYERVLRLPPNDRRPIAANTAIPGGHLKYDDDANVRWDGRLGLASAYVYPIKFTVETGGDDLRDKSQVFFQFHQDNGTFYEITVNPFTGGEKWDSDTTNERTFNSLPFHLLREPFRGHRLRFVGSQFGNESPLAAQIDEWTFAGLEIEQYGTILFSDLSDSRHFRESGSYWLGGLGSSSAPLTEHEGMRYATTMWAEIPPIRDLIVIPHFNSGNAFEESSYPEWRQAFRTRKSEDFQFVNEPNEDKNSGQDGNDDEDAGESENLFRRYAFALEEGERPEIYLNRLAPDPDTGESRLALTYKRTLAAGDVHFRVLCSGSMGLWTIHEPDAEEVRVLPDAINGVEWCQVLIRGEAAVQGCQFFSVDASEI